MLGNRIWEVQQSEDTQIEDFKNNYFLRPFVFLLAFQRDVPIHLTKNRFVEN